MMNVDDILMSMRQDGFKLGLFHMLHGMHCYFDCTLIDISMGGDVFAIAIYAVAFLH